MITAIVKRHSVRQYLKETVTEQQLKDMISAAMYAPSANGIYPWDLVIVRQQETKDILAKVTPWAAHAKDADLIIAVIGHEKDSPDWVEDCSIVAEHIWLEATEQGLASCWIHIRGNATAEQTVKQILNVPADYRVLCLLPIGKPAKSVKEHTQDEVDKSRVKLEKYK